MKINNFVEQLEENEEYKNFKIKYPNAYMVAGFFVLDLETKQNVHQIDFYVPSEKKIAAFTLDGGVTVQLLDALNEKVPEKLDLNTNIDLDALEGILADEMHNRGISEDLRKIIAVVQNIQGKKIWNLNCVLSGMEILKSHVEDASKTVLKLEKTSLMDIMKKFPAPQKVSSVQPLAHEESEDEIEGELKKLDKIEEEIDKEKERLKKEMKEKAKPKAKK